MKNGYILTVGFLLAWSAAYAQKITNIEALYNNSFREWIIFQDDDLRGELRLKWIHSNDWTAWEFRLGDTIATIEQKWNEDPNLWSIRCNGITVTAKTAWAGEFERWKLNDGNHQFNWQSRYSNQRDEWELDTQKNQSFKMQTAWEGDPRDWVVEDNLPADVSAAMKIAMIFLTLHFSSPKV